MGYKFCSTAGDDSTGDGSAATPWRTISKAIASSPAYTLSGSETNNLVLAPGIYREVVTQAVSPTSGGPLVIVGDSDGSLFNANGGTGTTGPVEWRGWTDDATPITTGDVLSASGKSYTTLRRLKMISGNGSGVGCFNIAGSNSNWNFEDCIFVGSSTRPGLGRLDATAGAALNATFKRCDFAGVGQSSTFFGLQIRLPLNSSEYNVNVLVQNCNFFGAPGAIQVVQNGGSGSNWGTGITIQQNGFWFCFRGVHIGNNPTLTTPIGVYGNTFNLCCNAIVVTTSGQVVEDGNVFGACFANLSAGITAGTHSIPAACPAFNLHDERIFGGNPRPWGEPSATSPALAAGNYGTPPTVDIWNKTRPGTPSAGPLERDTFTVPTNTYIFSGEF